MVALICLGVGFGECLEGELSHSALCGFVTASVSRDCGVAVWDTFYAGFVVRLAC